MNQRINGYASWLRLSTPLVIGIGLLFVQDIRANVIKIEDRLRTLENRVTRIETLLEAKDGKRAPEKDLSKM